MRASRRVVVLSSCEDEGDAAGSANVSSSDLVEAGVLAGSGRRRRMRAAI
jgi:hypothetical protein